jgi:hypothetical protein
MASDGLKEMERCLHCLTRKSLWQSGLRLFCQWLAASAEPQWITELNIAALLAPRPRSYLDENWPKIASTASTVVDEAPAARQWIDWHAKIPAMRVAAFRRLPGRSMRQDPTPTVSRNSRDYETNDVPAAASHRLSRPSCCSEYYFIARPQHPNTSGYRDTAAQLFEHLLWHSLILPMI